MGRGHDFNGIGNEFAAGQTELHALMVHGQTVTHSDGRKFHGCSTRHAYPVLNGPGNGIQVDMTGNNLVGRIAYPDKRAIHFFFRQTSGIHERTVGGLFQSMGHELAAHCKILWVLKCYEMGASYDDRSI